MRYWAAVAVNDICSDLDSLADRLNQSEAAVPKRLRRTWKVDRNIWIRHSDGTASGLVAVVNADTSDTK